MSRRQKRSSYHLLVHTSRWSPILIGHVLYALWSTYASISRDKQIFGILLFFNSVFLQSLLSLFRLQILVIRKKADLCRLLYCPNSHLMSLRRYKMVWIILGLAKLIASLIASELFILLLTDACALDQYCVSFIETFQT